MKKVILALAFILGVSRMANAQVMAKKSPEQRAAHHTKVLQKKLNLSQEQATQVNAAFLIQATRMDSLKNSTPSADKKGKHLAAKSIRLATKKQVFAILNDEQKTKFAAWEKKHKGKHQERRAPKDAVEG
jgi:Spy/CpxP family protein refolding chaperone